MCICNLLFQITEQQFKENEYEISCTCLQSNKKENKLWMPRLKVQEIIYRIASPPMDYIILRAKRVHFVVVDYHAFSCIWFVGFLYRASVCWFAEISFNSLCLWVDIFSFLILFCLFLTNSAQWNMNRE